MPKIISPYKSKPRRSLRRVVLLFAVAYLIFRIFTFLALQTGIVDTLGITSPFAKPLECVNFDHGDPTSTNTSIDSIFNCDSPSGKCKWYHPAKFFHPVCGVGSKYAYLLDDVEAMRLNTTLWHEMPPIIVEWVSLSPEKRPMRRRKQLKQLERKRDTISQRQQQRHIFSRHNISMVGLHSFDL